MIDHVILTELEMLPVLTSPTGVRYVRATDIPDIARPAFEKWATDIDSPRIPGERPGDAIYEDDFREWLRVVSNHHH